MKVEELKIKSKVKVQIICMWFCQCHYRHKTRHLLPLWYRLTQVVLEERPLNMCLFLDWDGAAQDITWTESAVRAARPAAEAAQDIDR